MDTIKSYVKKFGKELACGLILLSVCSIAYCEQLTCDTTATLTRAWINDALLRLYNRANSGWETDNIASGAVQSGDVTSVVSPLNREFYNIGEYIYSGMSVDASSNLDSTISSGVAFIKNDGDSTLHMVVTAAKSKSFTASKDTWVYMSYTGEPYYNAQANGAAQPTTPDNHILLQKVVTNAAAITGVTDYRQLSAPNLRVYDDLFEGLVISRDATTNTTLTISPGEIELGVGQGAKRRNTASETIDFTTTGEGGLDTGAIGANEEYYIWAVPKTGNDTNFEGVASVYSTAATVKSNLGITTTPKLIGWCATTGASIVSPDSVGSNRKYYDAPNVVCRIGNDDISEGADKNARLIPGMDARFYSSGRPVRITFTAPIENDGGNVIHVAITADTATHILHTSIDPPTNDQMTLSINTITKNLASGWHWIRVYWWASSNNNVQKGATEGERVLIVEEL